MDDRKLSNQEADEMEASSNDSQDSVPENPLPLGGQALPSFSQDASLPPEPAAEQSSRPSVPTSVSEATEKIGSLLGTSRSSGCTPPPQSSSVQETLKPLLLRARKTCTRKNPQRARKTFPSSNTRVSASVSSSQDLNIVELGETSSADAPVSNQQHSGTSAQEFSNESDSSEPSSFGSDIDIKNRISDVQRRLFNILENPPYNFLNQVEDLKTFQEIFDSFSEKPVTLKNRTELSIELRRYLKEWRGKWSNLIADGNGIVEAFGCFIGIVVQSLVSTVLFHWSQSRLNSALVIFNYKNFAQFQTLFLLLQESHRVENETNSVTREKMKVVKIWLKNNLPPMRGALLELLKCIDASIIFKFERFFVDADISFLREYHQRKSNV